MGERSLASEWAPDSARAERARDSARGRYDGLAVAINLWAERREYDDNPG